MHQATEVPAAEIMLIWWSHDYAMSAASLLPEPLHHHSNPLLNPFPIYAPSSAPTRVGQAAALLSVHDHLVPHLIRTR